MKTLTQHRIEEILIESLRQVAGEKCPADWRAEDDVIECCAIESLHGVELACDLVARLGIEIPLTENPLIDDGKSGGKKRHRSFSEVVGYLERLTYLETKQSA